MSHPAVIGYGRGIRNFKKMYPKFAKEIKLDGDPVINKCTINY
jgi:hypothetical protein